MSRSRDVFISAFLFGARGVMKLSCVGGEHDEMLHHAADEILRHLRENKLLERAAKDSVKGQSSRRVVSQQAWSEDEQKCQRLIYLNI